MKTEKDKDKARVIEILKSHGIEMEIGGCGCCGSPWVTFSYRGEVIASHDEFRFDMKSEPEA